MGGSLTKDMKETMDKNFKDQKEFMLDSQKMQVERQIQMQVQMRERMMAQQMALVRERSYWWSAFYGLAGFGLIGGYLRSGRAWLMVPLVPLTFVVGYQLDMAFGNKMDRVIAEADNILQKERNLLALPGGAPTLSGIDAARSRAKK